MNVAAVVDDDDGGDGGEGRTKWCEGKARRPRVSRSKPSTGTPLYLAQLGTTPTNNAGVDVLNTFINSDEDTISQEHTLSTLARFQNAIDYFSRITICELMIVCTIEV